LTPYTVTRCYARFATHTGSTFGLRTHHAYGLFTHHVYTHCTPHGCCHLPGCLFATLVYGCGYARCATVLTHTIYTHGYVWFVRLLRLVCVCVTFGYVAFWLVTVGLHFTVPHTTCVTVGWIRSRSTVTLISSRTGCCTLFVAHVYVPHGSFWLFALHTVAVPVTARLRTRVLLPFRLCPTRSHTFGYGLRYRWLGSFVYVPVGCVYVTYTFTVTFALRLRFGYVHVYVYGYHRLPHHVGLLHATRCGLRFGLLVAFPRLVYTLRLPFTFGWVTLRLVRTLRFVYVPHLTGYLVPHIYVPAFVTLFWFGCVRSRSHAFTTPTGYTPVTHGSVPTRLRLGYLLLHVPTFRLPVYVPTHHVTLWFIPDLLPHVYLRLLHTDYVPLTHGSVTFVYVWLHGLRCLLPVRLRALRYGCVV